MEIPIFAPAVIPYTGSHLNTEVDQHLAKTTLGWRLLGISWCCWDGFGHEDCLKWCKHGLNCLRLWNYVMLVYVSVIVEGLQVIRPILEESKKVTTNWGSGSSTIGKAFDCGFERPGLSPKWRQFFALSMNYSKKSFKNYWLVKISNRDVISKFSQRNQIRFGFGQKS